MSSPLSLAGSSSQRLPLRRRRRSAPKPKLSSMDSFASPHVAMLENATLQVSIDDDDDHHHHFVLTTQRSGSANVTVSSQHRTFDELRQLKKKLLAVMQEGHFCQAECPWIYSYLKNYFPKKTSLTLSSEKRMAKRRDAIALCFTNVLQFVQSKQNHCCSVVTNDVAQELACVLFGYDLAEYSVQLLTPVETTTMRDTMNSFSSTSSVSESDDEELQTCQICKSRLHQSSSSSDDDDVQETQHQVQGQRRSSSSLIMASPASSSFGSRSSVSFYTTTLGCGHRFHDECILSVLNDTQRCPTCNHLEIS